MKTKLTILLLLITLKLGANPAAFGAFVAFTGWWTVGTAHFINFDKYGILHSYERSGVIISLSQDPTMAYQGIWDLKFRGGYKFGKWHYHLAYEHAFSPINLEEWLIGSRYQFVSWHPDIFRVEQDFMFSVGYETGLRKNEGQKVWAHRPFLQVDWLHHEHDFGAFINTGYTPRQELVNPAAQFREPWDWANGNGFVNIGLYLFIHGGN
jgi:hypothetical protein